MPVFELGHVEDAVEGRTVLLAADPPVFHAEPFEHRCVEPLGVQSVPLR